MLQWDRVKHLKYESFCAAYNYYLHKQIAIEVREHLAPWIENNFLSSTFDPGNPWHAESIRQLCTDFINEIERIVQSLALANHDFTVRLNLLSCLSTLKKISPVELYNRMKDCLREEQRLLSLEQDISQASNIQGATTSTVEVSQQLDTILNSRNQYLSWLHETRSLKTEIRAVQQQRDGTESYVNQLLSGNIANATESMHQRLAEKLANENSRFWNSIPHLLEREAYCLGLAENLVRNLEGTVHSLDKNFLQLIKWSEQPSNIPISLDTIGKWCTDALEVIFQVCNGLWECLNEPIIPGIQDDAAPSRRQRMQTLLVTLDMLKITIIESSLVVSMQPPQVIKKNTAFNSTVQLLCGNNYARITSAVTTMVLKESQAAKLFEKRNITEINLGCGNIVNNIVWTNWANQPSIIYQFNKVVISDLRPTKTTGERESEEMDDSDDTTPEVQPQEKKDKEIKAMEEKYCMIYFADLQSGNVLYKVWCCSVPFVYEVHTNQTVNGLGTIFWDKYFREPGRVPFVVPDKVKWSKMGPALNDYFKTMTKSPNDFSEINLRNLGTHIFQDANFSESSEVSRSNFFRRDQVSSQGKWGWFYSCVDLTNKHLSPYCQHGYVLGFINRDEAEHLLRTQKKGDFIVRYSNSVEGGVSITVWKPKENIPCTSKSIQNPELEAENSMPFTIADLDHLIKLRASIGDLIRTYPHYINVYAQSKDGQIVLTPKETAFATPLAVPGKKGGGNMTSKIKAKYVSMILILRTISEACLSGKT